MVVTTLAHGKLVFERLARNPWIILDTETEPKPPWKNKRDAITWGRMQITIFSACYRGESYSFPTSNFSPKYPSPREWFKLLKPISVSKKIVSGFSNANYDLTVFGTSIEFVDWKRIWDCMIAGWLANPAYPKGLKPRAALYGRFLQESKEVDLTNLDELAMYAEQDVIVSDEMFQMQHKGHVNRPKRIPHINSKGKIIWSENPMPKTGIITIAGESLRPFEHHWMNLIELPVLKSTMRAQRTGFPMDLQYLRKIKRQMDSNREILLKEIYKAAEKKINLASEKDLSWLFKKLGIHNPYKTPTGQMARGKNILPKLLNQHPIIQSIINQEKIETLISFYYGAKDKKGQDKSKGLEYFTNPDGRIHAMVKTTGAITGRGSCSNPNLTQIPSRADIYEIKKAFVAPGMETR
jgi:hypothetical protein